MDEAKLIDKLKMIEALFAGAATEGEKAAAERARARMLERLKLLGKEEPPIEYRFSMVDMWSRKVFVALLRRYEIRPYRYSGQRYTTVMARVSKRFVNETLWPEFQEISRNLRDYLSEVTERVVHQVIHPDSSEAEVVEKPPQLPLGGDVNVSDPRPGPESSPPEASAGSQEHSLGQASGDAGSKNSSIKKRKKQKKRKRR